MPIRNETVISKAETQSQEAIPEAPTHQQRPWLPRTEAPQGYSEPGRVVSAVMFRRALWLFGAAMALESLRRGFIGGSMMSLFIIKEFGLENQAIPTMNWMRRYLDIEEGLLGWIPPPLDALVMPFTDYHESAKLYLEILDILAEEQRPRTCQYYWGEGES